MRLLQTAVQAGYNDAARIAEDAGLDPLRGREDLAKLIANLVKDNTAKKEPKP